MLAFTCLIVVLSVALAGPTAGLILGTVAVLLHIGLALLEMRLQGVTTGGQRRMVGGFVPASAGPDAPTRPLPSGIHRCTSCNSPRLAGLRPLDSRSGR